MRGRRQATRAALKPGGQASRQDDSPWGYFGLIREGLDAGTDGAPQPAAVFRVDFVRGAKIFAVAALNYEEDGGAVALAFQAHQFFEMFGRPFADRVGEGGRAVNGHGHILDFDKTATAAAFQTEIEPTMRADFDFLSNRWITAQFRNRAGGNRFGDEFVRMHRVDAHPDAPHLNHFPGVRELAPFVGAERDIDRAARLFAAEHAAGVRAVGGDDVAVGEAHIGEKSFVALHQRSTNEFFWKLHVGCYSRRKSEFTRAANFLQSWDRLVRVEDGILTEEILAEQSRTIVSESTNRLEQSAPNLLPYLFAKRAVKGIRV